ncbi:MAG: M1 family aminopeptidase, partial [Ferruginibacter sp.]
MKHTIKIITAALLYFFPVYITAQDKGPVTMSSGGVLKPLQAIMDIRHYTLSLNVDIPQQSIDGFTEIDLILSQPTDTLLFDLTKALLVNKITVAGKQQRFYQQDDLIYIINDKGFAGRQKIKIAYSGKPPVAVNPPWRGGFSWKQDEKGNPWVAINCQMEGGKIYFPCKDHPSDEPNEGADLIITIPKNLTVAGPGLLQSVRSKKDKKTFHWKTNYTISNYCIVFNIGNYAVVSRPYTTIAGNTVPIDFYVLQEDKAHGEEILDLRERDCRILEKYFGEYPWVKEKIGIAQVPNPGMEHQTMITYGQQTGKFSYVKVNGQNYQPNVYHEFAHEWFANKVSNKDWAHMWIQEGITTYA